LRAAWDAPTTSPRDKKELLRAVLEEVIVSVQKQERRAHLTLRWRGGALTDTTLDLPRLRPAIVRTDEDTIALVRRLAAYYPDTVIAGILNRQGRTSAYGHRFDANNVGNLRRRWKNGRLPPYSAWRHRPSTAPSTTAPSLENKSLSAHLGAFDSQTNSAPASPKTLPLITSRCIRPCAAWVFRDKPCGNVSSAVNSKLSMLHVDDKKDCESR